jgi:hypothetical protein
LLPPVPPRQTVIYSADTVLAAVNGQHDIYLFVDALGLVNALGHGDEGLNHESAEGNNAKFVDSVIRQDVFIFLPLIQRN